MAAHFRALHDQTEVLAEADLHFHTGRQIKLHQRVNGFIRWLDDVQNTLMSANLVLVTRVFVDVQETRTVKRSLRVGSGIDHALVHQYVSRFPRFPGWIGRSGDGRKPST